MSIIDGFKNAWKFLSNFPDPEDIYGSQKEYFDAIQQRRDYRLGNQDKQLKVKFGQPDDNVSSNLIGKIINQSVFLLLSGGVDFDLPGAEETPEDVWLNACWEANHKDILLKDAALNAADSGTGYIKIQPEGVVGRLKNKEVLFPRLINLNPIHLTMFTNPEDIEQITCYQVQYIIEGPDGKPRRRREIAEFIGAGYDEQGNKIMSEGDHWEITNYKQDYGESWQLISKVPWDYSFPPIIHWKNLPNPNDCYGRPDIEDDILELQDKRNFNASNINKIIRYHAHPRGYGINVGKPEKESWGADQFLLFSGDESSKVANLEMQSDLGSSIQFYDILGKQMLDETNTVDISNLKDKLGQLTNFSVRLLFQDALWKMQIKRELFGQMLRELNHRLLLLGNMRNTDPGNVIFPTYVLPINEAEVIAGQVMELDMELVSKQTISAERGRDYEQEQERMASEKDQNADMFGYNLKNFERGNL